MSVGVGFALFGFPRRVRLCPLAGLGLGHVLLAFQGWFRGFIASAPIVSIIRRPRQPWLREIFESAMRPTSAFAVHQQRSQLIWDLAAQSITVGART
jgi:hypothetical protein